jgi:riboflavin synthase
MFTGIVEDLGTVAGITHLSDSAVLRVHSPPITEDAKVGDSIAVNGVCLAVVETLDGDFTADVMQETLDRTILGDLRVGDRINLERAVCPHDRLGGHIVQGHIDGTGTVISRTPSARWETIRIRMDAALAKYVPEKGAVAIDGVSLTPVEVGDDWFSIGLIPTTLDLTTLGLRKPGDRVNIEVDVLAKYLERLFANTGGQR